MTTQSEIEDYFAALPPPEFGVSTKAPPKADAAPAERTVMQRALACLRYLANNDPDHALEQNGIGFNGTDGEFGHSLADRNHLSDKQLYYAIKLLQKYRKQCERGGIADMPTMAEAPDITGKPKAITPTVDAPKPEQKRVSLPPVKKVIPTINYVSGQIVLAFSSFPGQDQVDVLKRIRQRSGSPGYEKATKHWIYNEKALEDIRAQWPDAKVPYELTQLAAELDTRVLSKKAAKAQRDHQMVTLANEVMAEFEARSGWTLEPYQREATLLAVRTPYHGANFFMRRGAGKTLPSLLTTKTLGAHALVLTTKSAMINWERESAIAGVAPENVHIYNWASQPWPDELPFDQPYVLIADESHKAKTPSEQAKDKNTNELLWDQDGRPAIKGSIRSFKYMQLAKSKQCQMVLNLSGTPFPNGRGIELLPQLMADEHWIAQNRGAYERTYCGGHKDEYGHWEAKGLEHADKLRQEISDCTLWVDKYRTKGVKMSRLPVVIEPSPERVKEHDRVMNELWHEHDRRIAEGEISSGAEALVEVGILRHAASVAKVDSVIALAHEYIGNGKPVLIFTQFRDAADMLVKSLNEGFVSPFDGSYHEAKCGQITGSVNDPRKRQGIVDQLTRGEINCLVNVFGAAQEALNIQAAKVVILMDRTWVPGDADQAEGRIDRKGQTENTLSIWVQYGPIDERLDGINLEKQENIDKVFLGKRKTISKGKGSIEELAQLTIQSIFESGEHATEAGEDLGQ